MLKIEGLRKIYKKSQKGLKWASFEIKHGEILCLAGPNGSGKTTLINTILGIVKKDSGNISLCNQPLENYRINKEIAYVSDEIILIEELTGIEYLLFIKKLSIGVTDKRIAQLLEIFDLKEDIHDLISSYSHGMKKKLQIISTIMRDFQVLILDEPYRGLDVEAIYIIKRIIYELKRQGKIILITSHDLLFVEEICDSISIISNGKILESGMPDMLKLNYRKEKIEDIFLEVAFLKERGDRLEKILNNFFNDYNSIQK